MVKVDLKALELALEFVSSGAEFDSSAYVSLDTGEVFCVSDDDVDAQYPDDLETSDRYLGVPDRNDLELGPPLAIRFAALEFPGNDREVEDIFRHRGAYSKFKGLLRSAGLLDKWHKYEKEQVEAALREWCEDNGIDLVKVRTDAADATT